MTSSTGECDFCLGERGLPVVRLDVAVPIWRAFNGACSDETHPRDLCQFCYDVTFGHWSAWWHYGDFQAS